MREEPLTYYSVKYFATAGIQELIGFLLDDGKYFKSGPDGRIETRFERVGIEIFPTKEEAVAAAKKKRDAKIKSLEKQIARLRELKF